MAELAIQASVRTRRASIAISFRQGQTLLADRVMRIGGSLHGGEVGSGFRLAALCALLMGLISKSCYVMNASMRAITHEFQIVYRVVCRVLVFVVNLLTFSESAADVPLHNQTVFKGSRPLTVGLDPHLTIAVWPDVSAVKTHDSL